MYTGSPPPHGGKLQVRLVPESEKAKEKSRAAKLPVFTVNQRQLADLEMLAGGAVSPLTGFMGKKDYESVVENMTLANGLLWSIPLTLAAGEKEADSLREGSEIALKDERGEAVAILKLSEKYSPDKKIEAQKVYGTTEDAHPGVAALYASGSVYLAGEVTVLEIPGPRDFQEYRLSPSETRRLFAEKGWRSVVGFQTRNPVHRAHEYLLKCALEVCDGLLLHPLVGATKSDDIPASVRMKCYEVLLKNYFSNERVLLSVNPANMYYAGPREASFTRSCGRTSGAPILSSGGTTPGWGNTTGHTTRKRSS
jgi:sulfate adenylyltransferase